MDIILISDIHSNLEALDAISEAIPNLPIYCVGDFVGYGANPKEIIQWAKEKKVKAVLGNHDYATLTGDVKWFNDIATSAINWTSKQINSAEKKFLGSFPKINIVKLKDFKMLMVHGSPTNNLFEYVHPATHEHLFNGYLKKNKVDIIVLGHTHIPFTWKGKNGTVINPGSVGQPRSKNSKAQYVILKEKNGTIETIHKAIPYDIETTAKKIKTAGLPRFLADRLFKGI